MDHTLQFYIDGQWVAPLTSETLDVINPATEQPIAKIAMGGADDVDAAVAAAKAAFETFSLTSREERLALLDSIIGVYAGRMEELADIISQEVGAPLWLAQAAQAAAGLGHLATARGVLADFEFEHAMGTTLIVREPVGVCGMITPWNWPLNQIACKVAPAIATGCTMVLKPSEVAPLNAIIFAEIMNDAGVPPGVFNLVNGDGINVGAPLAAHPDIDMVSFTGSTRAGIEVARAAAPTVKRVAQELGGKSANIILDDADFEAVISRDMAGMCTNSGQSCNAPTRMLVPAARMDEAAAIAAAAAKNVVVGDPREATSNIGPVVSATQYGRIQQLIEKGIGEGAKLEIGGPGKPQGLETGYFVQPTVFSHVSNDMTIAREEIFGPVLVMIGYDDDADAVRIANDTQLRAVGLHLRRQRSGERNGPSHPQRQRARQRRRPRLQRPVRRLPAIRQRPRVGSARLRGVPRDQGHHGWCRHLIGGGVVPDGSDRSENWSWSGAPGFADVQQLDRGIEQEVLGRCRFVDEIDGPQRDGSPPAHDHRTDHVDHDGRAEQGQAQAAQHVGRGVALGSWLRSRRGGVDRFVHSLCLAKNGPAAHPPTGVVLARMVRSPRPTGN